MAAARGLPIPPADVVPPELEYRLTKKASPEAKEQNLNGLTIPITGRSQSYQSDHSAPMPSLVSSLPTSSPSSPPLPTSGPSTPLFRTRAKTLASLTTSSRNNTQADMTPREFQLPKDPFVNGQPIEAYLYKDASECPICFLYYPPYLNTTRCCEQAICSECFVQIKRPDPHQPEHEQPDPNAPPMSAEDREAQEQGLLVSEVATCPYCKTPEFGITYTAPPFRRGLTYGSGSQPYQVMSARSSQTSISSSGLSPGPGRRRGTSLSASAPEVITTDKVRPDWASKLSAARAHAARRSAAATALHTAAYLMNGQNDNTRPFGPFARRPLLRRPTLEGVEHGQNPHLSALAMLAERQAARQQEDPRTSAFLPPPRASSSRRSRMDDLEELMMMEAIRLSLASEEERRKKEEKDANKKAKKEEKAREKERKKEEKAARKGSLFTTTSNGDGASSLMERSRSNLSSLADDESTTGKGKGIDRNSTPINIAGPEEDTPRSLLANMYLSETSQESLAPSIPISTSAEPFRRSHLRQMSNASSAASSIVEPAPSGSYPGSGTPPPGSLEPMFNFRSLAAMIGEDDKADESSHAENAEEGSGDRRHSSLEMRSSEGDAIPDDPSPSLSTDSQSQSEPSPLHERKDAERIDEKRRGPLGGASEAESSNQNEAS